MWHLVNPKLDDTVSKEVVIKFIKELIFIAIDLMLAFLHKQEKVSLLDPANDRQGQQSTPQNNVGIKEEQIMKQKAIEYLQKARLNQANVIENLIELLPANNQISKAELVPILRKQFFRSHQIRILLTSNVPDDKDEDSQIQITEPVRYSSRK